jgi:hypothetical protein
MLREGAKHTMEKSKDVPNKNGDTTTDLESDKQTAKIAPKEENTHTSVFQRAGWIVAAFVIGLFIGQMLGLFMSPLILQNQNGSSYPNGSSPAETKLVTISIYAADSQDSYQRRWGLTIDRPLPPHISTFGYVGADYNRVHYPIDSMTYTSDLTVGTHYLVFAISQVGGSNYGTYAGYITINGQIYNFSGLDVTNSKRIDFNV